MPVHSESVSLRGPLLTARVHDRMLVARRRGENVLACSLDLERSQTEVELGADEWHWRGRGYPYLERCKERTIYHWAGAGFEPVARFGTSLLKLVPTDWGPPTFEIDGVKMLPTKRVSPCDDARRKVALIEPGGKRILDTCAGLGYFAASCLEGGASEVTSYEINPDVLWLRTLNPWSPQAGPGLTLVAGDISQKIGGLADASFGAILHDPPRFGLAGELYSQAFYDELARVLKTGGRLFHYTGAPNRLTSGRDVPQEVARRLRLAGFTTRIEGDGVLAMRGKSCG
ncbi:MAG: methyltransferase domain-containing protein [Steroidobacteraceae bacterium]|jgi:predicted methyltransferase|nr:methyltransferase domain-containing protein [Steroidobacteraceae bacterium]MBP9128837.1 methyltransferase domain-containing protein [Steroidobacteraceae bacterium]